MNLDELQSVRSKERRTDSLQHLRDTFYEDVRDYLAGLKDDRDAAAERADDPFASPEVRQLTDEIESAREVVEAVYERRMGKLVKHASLVAAGMEPDEEGMTTEERDLFFDLVDRIQANKETVLGTIDASSTDATDAARDSPARSATDGVSAAEAMAGSDGDEPTAATTGPEPGEQREVAPGTEPDESADATPASDRDGDVERPPSNAEPSGEATTSESESPEPDATAATERLETDDRITLRMTADVGEILGVDDRAYDLESEDVVTLPRQNAEPLLEREAADRLE
jgi:DNA replication factor GINS